MSLTNILKSTAHRPWPLPQGEWTYYQEWNKALFLHYAVPADILISLIPQGLELDVFENKAWVSVVVFEMEKIRPRGFPALSFLSDFYEINVRTYVKKGDKSGVYFLNIEAQKALSAFISQKLSGLPYEKSTISASFIADATSIKSLNIRKGFELETEFQIGKRLNAKTALEFWLTERYCLYLEKGGRLFRYEIHHEEWELSEVIMKCLKVKYKIQQLEIGSKEPDLIHYSKGIRVLAWKRSCC
ncbi:YqjF family protein [Desertivirga brevis]|uniref:YqjF family protein n=1 Tax=Desertivirga brevis TaxID=2810310 RepID=UPI001A972EC0|nr:DUF2071 domain-containing protein [Pedobacter sp. SYSU D00873]